MRARKELTPGEVSMPERGCEAPAVVPLVDIYENEEEILLHVEMPGVDNNDIKVNLDNGKLYLSGIRKLATTGAVQWEEFGNVEFQRTFSVPQTIDANKVNGEMKDGVLRLHLPKSEAAKPRQIEIKAG